MRATRPSSAAANRGATCTPTCRGCPATSRASRSSAWSCGCAGPTPTPCAHSSSPCARRSGTTPPSWPRTGNWWRRRWTRRRGCWPWPTPTSPRTGSSWWGWCGSTAASWASAPTARPRGRGLGGPAALPVPGLGLGREPCGTADLPFRTKLQLVLEMPTALVAEGSLLVRWVTCDEGFVCSHVFLDGVVVLGLGCLAEVLHTTHVWTARPEPQGGSPSHPVFSALRPAGGLPGAPSHPRRRPACGRPPRS